MTGCRALSLHSTSASWSRQTLQPGLSGSEKAPGHGRKLSGLPQLLCVVKVQTSAGLTRCRCAVSLHHYLQMYCIIAIVAVS